MFAAMLAVVGVAMFWDALLPVVPGEVAVLSALTRAGGSVPRLVAVASAAAIASLLGQYTAYRLARRVGSVDAHAAERAPRWTRHALLVGGLVPGGRLAAATAHGVTGGEPGSFWRYATIGSIAGVAYLTAVGEAGRGIIGDEWWAPLPLALAIAALNAAIFARRASRDARRHRDLGHDGIRRFTLHVPASTVPRTVTPQGGTDARAATRRTR